MQIKERVKTMKNYLELFIEQGLVYKGPRYNFLLLKDLIEFARMDKLDIKIKHLKELLSKAGWKEKKASVSTTEGYQSKNIWFTENKIEKTRSLPVEAVARKNLNEAEAAEAERLVNLIFEKWNEIPTDIEGVYFSENELIFTNKGLKELLRYLKASGSIPKLSSIIRNKANKILIGEHFFGTSSRTVLFKNYYRLKRG